MENNKLRDKLKFWILITTYCVILAAVVLNFSTVMTEVMKYLALFKPLYYAIGIAFILNLPMVKIETYLKDKLKIKRKYLRTLSIILTLLFTFSIFYVISAFIFPQIVSSVQTLLQNVSSYLTQLINFINELIVGLNIDVETTIFNEIKINEIATKLSEWIYNFTPVIFDNTKAITSTLTNLVMGFMLSIYLLASKEGFIRQIKKVLIAFFGLKATKKIVQIGDLSNQIFANFVSGQLVEAVILGVLCYIGMLILKFPFAILISTVVTITAIVPIFGAIIGMLFGCVLILAISPIQVLWFILYFQLLQQFENNFIYPIVVGTSLGLPGIWVLLSLVVFGGMFGLIGMILAVPVSAVLYTLFVDLVNHIIENKRGKVNLETLEKIE